MYCPASSPSCFTSCLLSLASPCSQVPWSWHCAIFKHGFGGLFKTFAHSALIFSMLISTWHSPPIIVGLYISKYSGLKDRCTWAFETFQKMVSPGVVRMEGLKNSGNWSLGGVNAFSTVLWKWTCGRSSGEDPVLSDFPPRPLRNTRKELLVSHLQGGCSDHCAPHYPLF